MFIVFVLLAALVVVADRVIASAAEDRLAEQSARELQKAGATTAAPPRVDISGFPFLTQVFAGSYDKITIATEQAQSGDIKLETLTLVATDVKASVSDLVNNRGTVTAGKLTGSATMTWDTVRALIELSGIPVPFDPAQLQLRVLDNNVELRVPITILGQSVTLRATGKVSIVEGAVKLSLTDVGTDGTELAPTARALLNQFRNRLTATIRTPQMPYQLVINSAETGDAGVKVTATAADVQLAG
jgi:hypothetical protein